MLWLCEFGVAESFEGFMRIIEDCKFYCSIVVVSFKIDDTEHFSFSVSFCYVILLEVIQAILHLFCYCI